MSFLKVEDLKTSFVTDDGEVKAVYGIDLEINQGERVALIGETGCGKTILGLSIVRLLPENARIKGQVFFKKNNLLEYSDAQMRQVRGREIMMIFQNPFSALNPILNIEEQLCEFLVFREGMNRLKAKEFAENTLELCGLKNPGDILKRYPYELSGGELTRIMIATGIICRPAFLISDEPSKGLDVRLQRQIYLLFNKLCEQFNITLLFITHNLKMVKMLCEKIAVMYAGEIVEYCSSDRFFSCSHHPYTQAFLNALPENGMNTIKGNSPSLIDLPRGCRFYPRCLRAKKICEDKRPKMKEIEKDHFVRCFLYD